MIDLHRIVKRDRLVIVDMEDDDPSTNTSSLSLTRYPHDRFVLVMCENPYSASAVSLDIDQLLQLRAMIDNVISGT